MPSKSNFVTHLEVVVEGHGLSLCARRVAPPCVMPRICSAARSARASRNTTKTSLHHYAKPRNMDRLLVALYEAFQESGTTWISVEALLSKIEEHAQALDDTLGKKFRPYCRICLSALRRNSYVEYKIFDFSDDEVRIADYSKEIFEHLREAIPSFGRQSAGDLYRLKCDYLRNRVQPKSRRLPTRAELDRENIVLSQKNRELIEETAKLETELNSLKHNLTALPLQQSVQVLQREATQPNMEQLESRFTDSMYMDPVYASQGRVSVQQRPSMVQAVVRVPSFTRQNTIQTPIRQSSTCSNAAACYPTPDSPPRSTLARQDSHLLSPPASPSSRRSPPACTMPGALVMESLGDGGREPHDGCMDVDHDDDNGQIMTRPCTPQPAGIDNHVAVTFSASGFAPIPTQVLSSICACCAVRRNEVDSTTDVGPAMTACHECESKTKIIESNEKVISELRGDLEDHQTLVGNLQDLILEKIKKIRELTSSP